MGNQSPAGEGLEHRVTAFGRQHRTGLVTLVFTDLVGSTALKQRLGDKAAADLFQKYYDLVGRTLAALRHAEAIERAGDSFLLVFATPSDAVQFALRVRVGLRALAQETGVEVLDRIGIHVGEVLLGETEASPRPKEIFGIQIDTCSRVMSLAQASQILMTRAVFDSARQVLKGEDLPGVGPLQWLNHGSYLLKGLDEPVEICEVRHAGAKLHGAPQDTEKAHRQLAPREEQVLGWRPAVGQLVPNTRWLLESKLGEGGFGEVWLGLHQTLKERRVFKFCFQADRVRSLMREMTLFRLLKERAGEHPNIVRLLEVCFEQPPFYLEMEYVEGNDLKTWCDRHGGVAQIPLPIKLEIIAQAADGLQAAHDAGIIHRDVKPGNILVNERRPDSPSSAGLIRDPKLPDRAAPQVKLTDFGIGQLASADSLQGITRAGFTVTVAGPESSSQTGTRLYVAPEILSGGSASVRSDIYALGVVLFQLLTNDLRAPVTTDWWKKLDHPLLRQDLELCLAGQPTDRFAGAGLLARQLRTLPERQAAQELEEARRRAREQRAYRLGIARTAGVACIVVIVVSLLAVVAWNESRQAEKSAAVAALERRRALDGEKIARRSLYIANMNLAQTAWEQGNVARLEQLVRETSSSPERGFEWFYWKGLTHPELRTCRSHLGTVLSVDFSRDGRWLLTAGDDQTAALWDNLSGAELVRLIGHTGPVSRAAFSPDGKSAATASWDGSVKIWGLPSGRLERTLTGHSGRVATLAFSPDGTRLVTGGWDFTVRTWDVGSGALLATYTHHTAPVSAVAFFPDGSRLVSGSHDRTAKVCRAATGEVLREFTNHGSVLHTVSVSPDGRWVASAGGDQTVRVWDAQSGEQQHLFKGHRGVTSSAFSPDGRFLVTGNEDFTAEIWDLASGKELRVLKGHIGLVESVAIAPDSQTIATASDDQTVRLWSIEERLEPMPLVGHERQVVCSRFSSDGAWIITGSLDRSVRIWDTPTGRLLHTLTNHPSPVLAIDLSPDRQRLASVCEDNLVHLWDPATGQEVRTLSGHLGRVASVAWSPDGQYLLSASEDQRLKLWNGGTGLEQRELVGHRAPVRSVAWSPDGRHAASGGDDQTVLFWEAATGQIVRVFKGHAGEIWSVAFSSDGRRLASASQDRTVRVWDCATGEVQLILEGHINGVRSVAFFPDGERILTGGFDGKTKLWDAHAGRELLVFGRPVNPVFSVAASPDGERMVVGSWDSVNVWTSAPRQQVEQWEQAEQAAKTRLRSLAGQVQSTAGKERAQRMTDPGAVRKWLLLGPIALPRDQTAAAALDVEQIPAESALHPKGGDRIKVGGRELAWKVVEPDDYQLDFQDLFNRGAPQSVAYAVCYIQASQALTGLQLHVGSDDQAKIFLNGTPCYRSVRSRRFHPDQDRVPNIALRAGMNTLVFKVVNQDLEWKGSVRISQAGGAPVAGIKVSAQPD